MTEPRTPGEERLAQLAEPEKEVAAGTQDACGRALPDAQAAHLRRIPKARRANPRPPGGASRRGRRALPLAIDLTIVHSLIAPLSSPRPATYHRQRQGRGARRPHPGRGDRPRRDGLRAEPRAAAQSRKGLGRQGHRPDGADPRNLRPARPDEGRHAAGRAGASVLPEGPARPLLDPPRAPARRLRLSRRPGRDADRGRPPHDPGAHEPDRAGAGNAS